MIDVKTAPVTNYGIYSNRSIDKYKRQNIDNNYLTPLKHNKKGSRE